MPHSFLEGVTVKHLGPIPRLGIYIHALKPDTIQGPPHRKASAETLTLPCFQRILTETLPSTLIQYFCASILASTLPNPWLHTHKNVRSIVFRTPWQWDSSPTCTDLSDSHLVPFHGIKMEHWESNAYFASCLHYCSKWIKAWLLHSIWLIVLWPHWHLAAPQLGTSDFRQNQKAIKEVISVLWEIDPNNQSEKEWLLYSVVRKACIWYTGNPLRCLLVYSSPVLIENR